VELEYRLGLTDVELGDLQPEGLAVEVLGLVRVVHGEAAVCLAAVEHRWFPRPDNETEHFVAGGGRNVPASRIDRQVTEIPVISGEAVLAAIDASTAIERVREAFERYARGEWSMPPKVYLDSPPHGDFRAMPALGDGLALLKWVTSFPGNSATGLPVVRGEILLSDAETGAELAVIECSSVTSLRTGAAAAVSARALAAESARTVGVIGCGVNGAWAARCLAAAGYGPGVCADPRVDPAEALAEELAWRAGDRGEAAAQDLVVTVTPGEQPVVLESDLRPGQHFAVLGADAHGKQEVDLAAIERCRLFCDEWEQASAGGELANAVEAGMVRREQVTQLGDVLTGAAGRESEQEITLFDSTGLAIQDLAICRAVYERWQRGELEAPVVRL
jgi:alanine dehydrogenase